MYQGKRILYCITKTYNTPPARHPSTMLKTAQACESTRASTTTRIRTQATSTTTALEILFPLPLPDPQEGNVAEQQLRTTNRGIVG